MNLAQKSLHGLFMQNEKENTQHLDKECVQNAKTGCSAVIRTIFAQGQQSQPQEELIFGHCPRKDTAGKRFLNDI